MPISLNRSSLNRLLFAAAITLIATAMGWSLTQHSKIALLPVGIGAGMALWLVFAELGQTALWLWPPLGVLAAPLSTHLPGGKLVSFDRIWVGGMIVLLLSEPRVRAHARASRRMMFGLALLTLVLGARAIVTPASTLYPIRNWVDSLVVPLILFAVVRQTVGNDGRLAEKMAMVLMIAGALLAIIGIAEHIFGFELATASGSEVFYDSAIQEVRISGPYDVPETYSLAVVICLAATMYWLLTREQGSTPRRIGIGVVGLELLALYFAYFRVGWLSALIVIIAAIGLRPRQYGRAAVTVVVAAIVLVPAFAQLEKVQAFKQRVDNTENIYTRIAIYEQGWEIFKSAPLFGVGTDVYTTKANALPVNVVNGAQSQPYAHSSFFDTMAEDGIVGLIALLTALAGVWGLIRALRRAARTRRDAILTAVLAGAAVSYLIYSLSLTMLPYSPSNEMFAILLGIGAGHLDFLKRSSRPAPVDAPAEPDVSTNGHLPAGRGSARRRPLLRPGARPAGWAG